jgi:ABC-type branched-subunit amino acid transport system permease subunit
MIQKHKLFTPASTAWRPNRTTTGGVNVETAEPVIGADEWAAQVDQRRKQHIGVGRQLFAAWAACPRAARYGLLLGLALAFPLLADSDLLLTTVGLSDNSFLLRTAVRCFTFAILALGLTVVVGYAGLLDLGYIAFMGLAGYFYAYLSSDFVQIAGIIPYGLAIPSIISLPLIVLTVAAIGYGIGAISMRLAGDYLAIVTLGFGQVFLQLALTMTRVHLPGRVQPVDFTHGPNGINQLAPLNFFGYAFATTTQYYYLFLSLLVLVYILVTHLNG